MINKQIKQMKFNGYKGCCYKHINEYKTILITGFKNTNSNSIIHLGMSKYKIIVYSCGNQTFKFDCDFDPNIIKNIKIAGRTAVIELASGDRYVICRGQIRKMSDLFRANPNIEGVYPTKTELFIFRVLTKNGNIDYGVYYGDGIKEVWYGIFKNIPNSAKVNLFYDIKGVSGSMQVKVEFPYLTGKRIGSVIFMRTKNIYNVCNVEKPI